MRGRPPSWNPFAQLDAESWIEVAHVDEKGRLSLPAAARRRVDWIKPGESATLLADLGEAGYAELSLWTPNGLTRVAEITTLAERVTPEERSQLVLAAMDRFLKVSLEDGSRVHLPPNLRAHLDPDRRGSIRVIVRNGRLWLWSEIGWQGTRADRLRAIDATIAPAEAPLG